MGSPLIAERTEAPASTFACQEVVSVVLPVHNGEGFLGDAIDSVLAQTGVEIELIVVDDGSTDGTPHVIRDAARDPRVVGVFQSRRGVAAARNIGLLHARGDLIAFLDADDVFLPGKLRQQTELFAADPALAMAFTSYAVADEQLRPLRIVREADLRAWALLDGEGPALASTSILRRSIIGDDLRFDEELSTVADVEFALRAARRGTMLTLPEPLTLYRRHARQMSRDNDTLRAEYPVLVDKLFADGFIDERDRRRALANLSVRMLFARGPAAPRRISRSLRDALAVAPSRLVVLPVHALGRRAGRWLGTGRRALRVL